MWKIVLNTIVKPTVERLGTVGATALIVGGDWLCANWSACGLVTEDGAHEAMKYIIASGLVLLDVAVGQLMRRTETAKGAKA